MSYFFYRITSSILSARIAADAADIKRVNKWIKPQKKVDGGLLAKVRKQLGASEEEEDEFNPDNVPTESLTRSK